jgi:hypothetical protein
MRRDRATLRGGTPAARCRALRGRRRAPRRLAARAQLRNAFRPSSWPEGTWPRGVCPYATCTPALGDSPACRAWLAPGTDTRVQLLMRDRALSFARRRRSTGDGTDLARPWWPASSGCQHAAGRYVLTSARNASMSRRAGASASGARRGSRFTHAVGTLALWLVCTADGTHTPFSAVELLRVTTVFMRVKSVGSDDEHQTPTRPPRGYRAAVRSLGQRSSVYGNRRASSPSNVSRNRKTEQERPDGPGDRDGPVYRFR